MIKVGCKYKLLDIEITEPLSSARLSGHMCGIAVLVRYEGRPIHFSLKVLPTRRKPTEQELNVLISRESGLRILKAKIAEELKTPVTCTRLPSVTVAVCTKDRTDRLARCLKSVLALEANVFGIPVRMEIRVIDNAPSTQDTNRLVSSLRSVGYSVEPRPGLDFARNRALREARGDLLAFIDDDVVVDRGWLRGLMEAWMAHPAAAAFTGQVLPLELATKAQILFERRGGFRRGFNPICYDHKFDGHYVYPLNAGIFGTGANMAFQTHILRKLNGFDEALDTGRPLPAAGDHDIFYRIIRAGYSIVYEPCFLVFHEHRREVKALLRQYWSWGQGVMTFVDKVRRTDPFQRKKRRYLIRCWFGEHISELIKSLLRKAPVPCYMVLAEMAGGLVALFGGYERSVRRIERIRKQFPSELKAESSKLKATETLQSETSRQRPDALSSRFKPWEILNLDLSQGISPFSRTKTEGIFVVFWWRTIPLGHHWIAAGPLPIPAAQLKQLALTAITATVASHVLGTPIEATALDRSIKAHRLNPTLLPSLDGPLQWLNAHISLPEDDAPRSTVSVVVCTRDRPEQLKRCLDSLQRTSKKPNEIIVVDNAPQSEVTHRIVSQFPDMQYIREPRPGLDIARNIGIENASGELVAFTDDDAIVHADWVEKICQGFKDPQVMAVTGLVLPPELETEAQYLFETHWGFGRGYIPKTFGRRFFDKMKSHGVPTWEIGAGANMAFRREVFAQVGLFDERLDVGAAGCSGDSEMWYRILAQGWACRYEPCAVVYHFHRRDMVALERQLYHYMRGHVTALLIQFEKHRHWGNLRRLAFSLPWYYGGLLRKKRLCTLSGRERTLRAEVSGALSGIKYYFLNRHLKARRFQAF